MPEEVCNGFQHVENSCCQCLSLIFIQAFTPDKIKSVSLSETIFITGFPGFIAEQLILRLAKPDVRFYFLVQPQFINAAFSKLEKLAAACGISVANFALVEGDITKPDCGIVYEDLEVLRGEVTSVFHLAAVYDLEVDADLARSVNLEGTKSVNLLVRSMPHLRRYNYISTCYVAGKRQGRISETDLEHDAGFRNFYEETKYLAELEVEKLKKDLPVTIFRPAVVVGDSQTGETIKYDGIYSLIRYLMIMPSLLRFVNIGNHNVKLNLVPVDFVADSIAALAFDRAANGKTLAIADPSPLTTSELFDVFSECLTEKASIIHPPVTSVERILMMDLTQKITGLPSSGVPYFFIEQEYDTTQATALLKEHGIECPRFADYAPVLTEFVRKHPQI